MNLEENIKRNASRMAEQSLKFQPWHVRAKYKLFGWLHRLTEKIIKKL